MSAIRDVVDAQVPAGETVAVVSRGDDELLELGAHTAWHFPQDEDGAYVGYHPHDSAEAITHLEALRSAGRAVPARARRPRTGGSSTTATSPCTSSSATSGSRSEEDGCLLFELSLNRSPRVARRGRAR